MTPSTPQEHSGIAHELARLRYTLSARLSVIARFRWLFWRHVARYELEMCHDCGRRVGPDPFSWWHAPDDLWTAVQANTFGVLCPACFTRLAAAYGLTVWWQPVIDGEVRP
jgi:hypothetical protein